jgi:hypothetical protein
VSSSAPTVRDGDAYEARLRELDYEQCEEARALQSGEKDVSEMAEIYERYADLFSREQLEALRQEEEIASTPDPCERLYRLRKTCEAGLVSALFAAEGDELANAEFAARVEWDGESLPLRDAQTIVGALDDYVRREELGARTEVVETSFNDWRLRLLRQQEALVAELSGVVDPVARADEEKGIVHAELARVTTAAASRTRERYAEWSPHWLDVLLGEPRAEHPPSYHALYMRRFHPVEETYTKARLTSVCLATLQELGFDLEQSGVRADLDDRPQKEPRACVLAADPPAVVHLITRPQGGLQDYADLLHEAGHALHFTGCDPGLPFAFRGVTRDNALTEIFSYICESITREPGWHERYFDLAPAVAMGNAEMARFFDAFMFRRYTAKLEFELGFWSRFSSDGGTAYGYAGLLSDATGFAYNPARFLVDMDAGFYVADYLRAWIRAAQLRKLFRERSGDEWWRSPETGDFLRELFREGLRPSSEDIAVRLGFDPLDTGPLVAELNA